MECFKDPTIPKGKRRISNPVNVPKRNLRLNNNSNPYVGNFGYLGHHIHLSTKNQKANSFPQVSFEKLFHVSKHEDRLEPNVPYFGTFRHAPKQAPIKLGGLTDILSYVNNEKKNETKEQHILTQRRKVQETISDKPHMVEEELIHYPTIIYNGGKADYLNLCDKTCVICLEDLYEDDELRVLSCSHWFHKACIDRWFLGKFSGNGCRTNRCPVCNAIPKPGDNQSTLSYNTSTNLNSGSSSKHSSEQSDIPSFSFFRVGEALCKEELHDESVKKSNENSKSKTLSRETSTSSLDGRKGRKTDMISAKLNDSSQKRPNIQLKKKRSNIGDNRTRQEGLHVMLMILDAAQVEEEVDEISYSSEEKPDK